MNISYLERSAVKLKGFIHLPTGNVALVIVKGMTEHKAFLDPCPSSCGSTSRWRLGDGWVMAVDGWVMVVVDSLAPPAGLLTPAPTDIAAGQQPVHLLRRRL